MAFNCIKISFVLLTLLATFTQIKSDDYCFANDLNPYIQYGPITAYEFVHGNIYAKDNNLNELCTPVQFWSANRHGTRLPVGNQIGVMKSNGQRLQNLIINNYEQKHSNPENGSLCDADLENLKAWTWNDNITIAHSLWLTQQGFMDLENIGARYKSSFPSLFDTPYNLEDYQFYYSDVERLRESMEGFMTGVFGQTEDPSGQIDNNTYVGPYDDCAEYQVNNMNVELPTSEKSKFTRTPEYRQVVKDISRRLGFSTSKLTQVDIETMYNLCRYEKAWNPHELSPWCAAFTPDQLPILEYDYDLDGYYKTGYGYKYSENFGCLYIGYLLDSFQRVANSTEGQPKVVAYFTHAEMVQMFMVALGVNKDPYVLKADNYDEAQDRNWRTSLISPFATNLVSIFYNCPDGSHPLLFYLNEKRLQIDGCDNGICDWDYFYNTYVAKANDCHQNFCL